MTKATMLIHCRKLAYRAGSTDEKSIKDLLKKVWPWWNDLSHFDRGKILAEKANPASVYLIGMINMKRYNAWVALPWWKKVWLKLKKENKIA